ncbi:MAG TPA: protein translocase component YidC, partial [Thermoanaerobaculia bacterium]|nr:protein translocase component YidC [Thermoanaerobaculia bacterium]
MSTERRLLLAAALSLGVLLLWTRLFPEKDRRPAEPVSTPASAAAAAPAQDRAAVPAAGRPAPASAPAA